MDDRDHARGAPPPHQLDGDARATAGHDPVARDDGATGPDADARRDGAASAHEVEPNRLLRALPLDEYQRLLPQLVPTRLPLKKMLVEPNVPITDAYFIREGVGSMIATEQEGGDIEVGTVGNEGLVGLPLLHGADMMPFRVMVQVEGDAWRLPAGAFRRVVDERPVVRHLLLRYAQYFADQLAQSVACNRLHTLEERCARWLLMTHDRVYGDAFELTHEFLALMLGVRRAGVTVAMGELQSAGILTYARGRIRVLDRPRLEEASCQCYHVTRTALVRLLG